MAERVGRSLPGRALAARARRLPAAAWFVVLVALALVVAVVVAIVGHSSNGLSAQVSGVDRQNDPRHFTFTYELTKNPLSTSACTFEVQGADHGVVGHVTDRQGPTNTNAHTTRHVITADTTALGVTAVLDSCQLLKS